MITDEIRNGMSIVEDILRARCATCGVTLDSFEWGQTEEGFDKRLYSLAYTIGGKRKVERFSHEDLSDAPGDPGIRDKIMRRIDALVQAPAPTKDQS